MKALHRNMISRELADVHTLYYTQNRNPINYADETGTICHPVFNPITGSKAPVETLKAFSDKFDEITNKYSFDLFHVHYGYYQGAYLTMFKAIRKGLPTVFSFHGGGLKKDFSSKLKRVPLLYLLPRVDLKMGICRAAAEVLGLDTVNIGTYIDENFFDPKLADPRAFRERLGIKEEHILLFPGRIEPNKGQTDLVSVAKILKSQGVNFKVVIVGPKQDEGYVGEVRKKIKKNRLENKVEIYRSMDHAELRDGYSTSIIVLPSYSEGAPRVVLEGLAMEAGVVANDVGGTSEFVIPNETGILVQPKKPKQMAEGVLELIGNPGKRREMGRKGRTLTISKCNLDQLVDRYMERYEKVLESRS